MTTPQDPDSSFALLVVRPKISIGISLVMLTIVSISAYVFHKATPDERETMKFLVEAGALAAGIVSVYHVWHAIRTLIQQRHEFRREQQVQLALDFVTRWNDPSMANTRKMWREI